MEISLNDDVSRAMGLGGEELGLTRGEYGPKVGSVRVGGAQPRRHGSETWLYEPASAMGGQQMRNYFLGLG